MARYARKFVSVLCSAALIGSVAYSAAAESDLTALEKSETKSGTAISNDIILTDPLKSTTNANPLSPEVFCADPTAVEYNGRLYVYGTNDQQQYEEKGADEDNTYEKIKSLVVFSTDDMVNWEYHGEINVGEVAPWVTNSWAPSITSRVEEDGLTHFYLYFSNNGMGVGVITATNPLGPWSDPLGKPFVQDIENCPNPFDPGVVIDENGDGWLTFGGGKASGGTDYMPGSARIVKLGDDMLSFASDITEIPAPYFFEASELNYINGTYVYTYCSDWSDHSLQWDYDTEVPGGCSMIYMTTKTPLDPSSWEVKGECFKNPGNSGFEYSNNHTHMQKYNGKYYMLYHTLSLKGAMGIKGGYRSLCADEINVDETTVTIEPTGGTKKGITTATLSPYTAHSGAQYFTSAGITTDTSVSSAPTAVSNEKGAWLSVKNAVFTESENDAQAPEEPVETPENIKNIAYNFTVTDVDKPTTVTMFAAAKDSDEVFGSVKVDGNGKYTINVDFGDTDNVINLGYFRASDDAKITFNLDSITVNGKYTFDISSELTNTREWADGLKNIWNGFSDNDEVYSSDQAIFRYNKNEDVIKFYNITGGETDNSNAPLTDKQLVFLANAKGNGRIEVRLDSPTGDTLCAVEVNGDSNNVVYDKSVSKIGGTHDLYFVFSDKGIALSDWQFSDIDSYDSNSKPQQTEKPADTTAPATEKPTETTAPTSEKPADTAKPDETTAPASEKPADTAKPDETTAPDNGKKDENPSTGSAAPALIAGIVTLGAVSAIIVSKKNK